MRDIFQQWQDGDVTDLEALRGWDVEVEDD